MIENLTKWFIEWIAASGPEWSAVAKVLGFVVVVYGSVGVGSFLIFGFLYRLIVGEESE